MTEIKFTHDDPRGCIFDMNGADKKDIVYSTNKPEICNSCVESFINNKAKNNSVKAKLIDKIQIELQRINKGLYFEIADHVKKHPVFAILFSSLAAIMLDVVAHFISAKLK